MRNAFIPIAIAAVILFIAGCDVKNGTETTMIDLPTDVTLDLYSADEGIYPNTDILDDPKNPYANANLNSENVWDLYDECPSAKAKFYLWATMLARQPMGEYQYYTAQALHELYTEGGSENAHDQAIRAYRAVLDYFYDSVTWWNAWWIDADTYYAVVLRNMVGEALYDPTDLNLLDLYGDPAQALADLSEWGYVYDQESGTITKIQ